MHTTTTLLTSALHCHPPTWLEISAIKVFHTLCKLCAWRQCHADTGQGQHYCLKHHLHWDQMDVWGHSFLQRPFLLPCCTTLLLLSCCSSLTITFLQIWSDYIQSRMLLIGLILVFVYNVNCTCISFPDSLCIQCVCVSRAGSGWGRVKGYWSPAAAQTRAYYCYPTECHLSHTLLASCLHTPDLSLHKPIVNACHAEGQKPSLGRLTRLIKNDTEPKPSAAFRRKI